MIATRATGGVPRVPTQHQRMAQYRMSMVARCDYDALDHAARIAAGVRWQVAFVRRPIPRHRALTLLPPASPSPTPEQPQHAGIHGDLPRRAAARGTDTAATTPRPEPRGIDAAQIDLASEASAELEFRITHYAARRGD